MNTIKVNGNKALVFQDGNIKIQGEYTEINYSDVTIYISNNTICVHAPNDKLDSVTRSIASSLVGEDGEISFYNPKEESMSIKKVGDINSRNSAFTKKLTNK